jgi:hypothetical protein
MRVLVGGSWRYRSEWSRPSNRAAADRGKLGQFTKDQGSYETFAVDRWREKAHSMVASSKIEVLVGFGAHGELSAGC